MEPEVDATHHDLSVCLFCGSSDSADPALLNSAAEFGATLAREGVRLVYGGGGVGLMGAAARAAHHGGGRVLGVMPQFLRREELLYDEVETVVVDTMHDRKRLMFELSDAFAVFPGGIGTLEEAIELISWRRLHLHCKPIVFFNPADFWRPLFQLVDHMIDASFTPAWLPPTWRVANTPAEVLPLIRNALLAGHDDEGGVAKT